MTDTPQPPYEGYDLPEQYRNVPYDELPFGLKKRFQA